jgi:predicted SnoaL-like aldol condensation-catalyzing enzyme
LKYPSRHFIGAVTLLAAGLACAQGPDLNSLHNDTVVPPAVIDGALVMIPSGKKNSAREEANRRLVLGWFDDFWNKGNFDHWPKYLAADFRNHDPAEPPVGAQALVNWLNQRLKESGHGKPPPKSMSQHLFVLADGDLVFVGHMGDANTDPQIDPAGSFAGNILRVEHGKIVEWWYTGVTGTPAAMPAPAPAAPSDGGSR